MIFEIPIQEDKKVFLTKRHNSNNAAIVMVEAEKLLELWKNEPYHPEPQLAFGTELNWKSDYKYNRAEKCFSKSAEIPVPVAKVAVGEAEKHEPIYEYKFKFFRKTVGYKTIKVPYIGFIDGITRSIWLLVNQALAFPIECDINSAQKMHKLAGIKGSEIIAI